MAKATSLENNLYPFGTLAKSSAEKMLTDDYPKKDCEIYKLAAKTTNGAAVAYKATCTTSNKSGNYEREGSDEFKLTFPFQGTGIIGRILANRKGDFEGHLDFGNKNILNTPFNTFANVKTNFGLNNFVVRAGLNYFSAPSSGPEKQSLAQKFNLNYSSHFATDFTSHSTWQRLTIKKNNIVYGLAANIQHDLSVNQYDEVIGYEHKDFDVYVKHLTNYAIKNIQPQLFSFESLYRLKNQTISLVVQKDFGQNDLCKSFEIGGQHKIDDKTNIKAKINKDLNLALSCKYKRNDTYTFSCGGNIPCTNIAKKISSSPLPFDFGFQIDVNV